MKQKKWIVLVLLCCLIVVLFPQKALAAEGTVPMYRLYNPNSGEHFYTGSYEERDILVEAGWNYEGVAWNAPLTAGDPVYRVYNPNSGDHHYTMDAAERDWLVGLGWQYEGVAWNSFSDNGVPQYRLWNPNADLGSHHYTSSTDERDFLISLGWIPEGIGWYGSNESSHAHTWSDWETAKEASAVDPGEECRTCTVCGTIETQEIEPTGFVHNWQQVWYPEEGHYSETYCVCACGWRFSHASEWPAHVQENAEEALEKHTNWGTAEDWIVDSPEHTEWVCSDCGASTETSDCLHDWQKFWHPEEGHYGDTYCVCKCGYRFSQSSEWSSHLNNFSGEDLVFNHTSWGTAQDWIVDSPEYTEWCCSGCGEIVEVLAAHKESNPTEEFEPIECEHSWQKIWHPEEGHYGDYYVICMCGSKFQNSNQWVSHVEANLSEALEYHTSWSETRDWVVDSPEYTEWVCSKCGETTTTQPSADLVFSLT